MILPPIFANAETGTPDVTILYEEISLRQEHTKHFVCSDGSYLAISYPEPVHYLDNVYAYASIDNSNGYFLTTSNSLKLGYPVQVLIQSKSSEASKLGYTSSGHFFVLKGQYYNPISQIYETVSNDCHYMFGPNDNNSYTNDIGGRDLIIDFTTFYTISYYKSARIAYGVGN